MQQATSSKAQSKKSLITKFTDLNAWQEGHKLVLSVYSIAKSFPSDEQFGLSSQMRRCAVSITSNVAEGFSRPTGPDKIHFYSMAKGSLTELQNQLLVARDVGYINSEEFSLQAEQSITVHKLLTGLIKSLHENKGVN